MAAAALLGLEGVLGTAGTAPTQQVIFQGNQRGYTHVFTRFPLIVNTLPEKSPISESP